VARWSEETDNDEANSGGAHPPGTEFVAGRGSGASTYVHIVTYAPAGAPLSQQLSNGVVETMAYNNRQRMASKSVSLSCVSLLALGLSFCPGQAASCATNNGNLLSQTISHSQIGTSGQPDYEAAFNQTQLYTTYDEANRLKCSSEGPWQQVYGYDVYGNRWVSTNTLPVTNPLTATQQSDFNPANNRIRTTPTGEQHDAAGNLTRLAGGAQAGHELAYDGENRLARSDNFGNVITYVYDGLGRRVKAGNRVFAYLATGELGAEYGGTVLNPGTTYLTADHLGSTRLVTKQDGSMASRYDYAPFGEDLGQGVSGRTDVQGYRPVLSNGTASGEPWQRFTGKERDAETGLDYFGARYFSGAQGRFTNPDPLLGSANPLNPQSWNRYTYTLNNPLRYTDPFGLYEWDATLGGSATDDELRKQLSKKAANKIIDRRTDIRKAIAKGVGSNDADVSGAYQAYGAEGEANGVTLASQKPKSGGVGAAGQQLEYVDGSFRSKATVSIDPKQSGNDLFITLAHEGSHVRDGQAYAAAAGRLGDVPALAPFNLTVLQTEMNAYSTSVNAARMLGLPNLNYSAGSQTYQIWRGGTAAVDRPILEQFLRASPLYAPKLNDLMFPR